MYKMGMHVGVCVSIRFFVVFLNNELAVVAAIKESGTQRTWTALGLLLLVITNVEYY